MIQDTPIGEYEVHGNQVYVKREDLACLPPGPPFAKVRGLLPILQQLKERGVNIVGYMETSISMAGWGISYFCKELGMKAVIFYPEYRDGYKDNQEFQVSKWEEFEAEVIPLERPNRMSINFYRAKKLLLGQYQKAQMLPLGLPFEETIEEVSKQVFKEDGYLFEGSIVFCVGSGTMASGILRGLHKEGMSPACYGVLVAKKNTQNMRKKIIKMAGLVEKGFFHSLDCDFLVMDLGYEYTDSENVYCPFPCNSYYDRKAWKWLLENIDRLKKPILFWNIGA